MHRWLAIAVTIGVLAGALPSREAGAVAQTQAPAAPGPARDTILKTGTASIRGRVFAAGTESPLARADVRLGGAIANTPFTETPIVTTDDQGRFEFRNVPAGRYTLQASKTGYITLSYGQRRMGEGARPLNLADGQSLDGIDFGLPKGGTIAVRLTDPTGEPIAGATVRVLQRRYVNGERRLQSVGALSVFARTNDRGELRRHGLGPGEYYVMGSGLAVTNPIGVAPGGRSYAPTYYPGTLREDEAQVVSLGLGAEVHVTFAAVPIRFAQISGMVRTSEGGTPRGMALSLGSANSLRTGVSIEPDGRFALSNIAPGEYMIAVSPSGTASNATREYARALVTVFGDDITNLLVRTSRGSRVRGRLVFEGIAPPADVRSQALRPVIRFTPSFMGTAGTFAWQEGWTFEIAGPGGEGLVRLPPILSGWFLKAVMLDGRDIIDTPVEFGGDREFTDLEVVLTAQSSEVLGTVADAGGNASADYVAVLFPQDNRRWKPLSRFIAAGRPDLEGRFAISGMPPGDYLIAAIQYLETGSEQDPEVLGRLRERATRVSLSEGEREVVRLTVIEP